MDPPGERLAQELARRIGYERCPRISWHPYKDANEMLLAQGPTSVLDALATLSRSRCHPITMHPSTRPVRLIPPVRGRRPVIALDS